MLDNKIKKNTLLDYYNQNILLIEQSANVRTFKRVNQSQLNKILASEHDDFAVIYNADMLTEEQLELLELKMPISKISVY